MAKVLQKGAIELNRIVLFGGTSEGRRIAELLNKKKFNTSVCVATEYGEELIEEYSNLDIRRGRLDAALLESWFSSDLPNLVIDATHPYAVLVSENVRNVCKKYSLRYIRVKREELIADDILNSEGIRAFSDINEMIMYLNSTKGKIFSTMGAKEAEILKNVEDYINRIYIRVLPFEESINHCLKLGFRQDHIIAAKGPFSVEDNMKMFENTATKILITKESGRAGGYLEKMEAAGKLGIKTAVLLRPKENGISEEEIIRLIEEDKL